MVEQYRKEEEMVLPEELDYDAFTWLSNEAKEKLLAVRPPTLGAASRLQGVTVTFGVADVVVAWFYAASQIRWQIIYLLFDTQLMFWLSAALGFCSYPTNAARTAQGLAT